MLTITNKKIVLVVIAFLLSIVPVQIGKAQVAAQDSLALVDLYNNTNGSGWTHKNNWLTGSVNTWYGVVVFNKRVHLETKKLLSTNDEDGNER